MFGRDTFGRETDFAILPKAYPGYAMGLNGHGQLNDVFVLPQRMWGGIPTLSQAWIIADAPQA
jgi:hypothetical protein